jgi:membrane-associated phospholipid phosphatase
MKRLRRATTALALLIGLRSGFAHADTSAIHDTPPLTRGDLGFLAAAAGGVTWAMANDRWLTREAIEDQDTRGARGLANAARPFGTPEVILPAAALLYAAGRWGGHPRLESAAWRGGASVVVAGAVTLALKEAFGRARPEDAPDDPYRFRSLSGQASFPSGHAALAFAAAAAIQHEAKSRWIPFVVYPAAGLVAWSRVRDREHWTSDVIAGAAIGGWTSWKTASFLAQRDSRTSPGAFGLAPSPAGPALACTFRF